MSTCVDEYTTNGEFPQVTQNAVLFVVATGILAVFRSYTFYLEFFDKPPTDDSKLKRPSYGLGAISTIKYLCGIGLVLSGPQALLYFAFRWAPGSRSLEFACLAQDGIISFLGPFLIAYMILLLIITNALRSKTRHTWADTAKPYLLPVVNNAETDVHRIMLLPILRGMWVPPLVRAFQDNLKQQFGENHRMECYALDSFGSQYCTDTADWFQLNMKLEKVHDCITTIWTDFSKFPIADNTIDVICMPTGMFLPYINDNNLPEEEIEKRKTIVMSEILRVLKPGGVLIGSNISMLVNGWETLVKENGFVNIETLSKSLWWSYMPAKMTLAFKSPNSEVVSHNSESNGPPVQSEFIISKDNHSTHIEQARTNNMWFPPGRHWRLVELLCLSTLLAWIVLILLVWGFMGPLQTPKSVPYGQRFASLFVSNLISLPIIFFTMFSDLRNVGKGLEIAGDKNNSSSNSTTMIDYTQWNEQQLMSLRIHRILRTYKKHLLYLSYLLGILTWLSWLPYFILDIVLFYCTSLNMNKIQFINSMVGIGIFFTLIPIAQFISLRLKQQNKEMAMEDANDEKMIHEQESSNVSPMHVTPASRGEDSKLSIHNIDL